MRLLKQLLDSCYALCHNMKEHKYLLLGLSFFFFSISFVSCRNQKAAAAVVHSDSVEENESENSNLLEIIKSHKYIYGDVRMSMDTSFSIMDTQPFPFNDSLLMVTGMQDQLGPTYSFIINTENKQAILLPSNRGCLGFTSEEGLPICLSFRHHANGDPGRFSVVTVYDERGKLVKEMSLEGYEEEIK